MCGFLDHGLISFTNLPHSEMWRIPFFSFISTPDKWSLLSLHNLSQPCFCSSAHFPFLWQGSSHPPGLPASNLTSFSPPRVFKFGWILFIFSITAGGSVNSILTVFHDKKARGHWNKNAEERHGRARAPVTHQLLPAWSSSFKNQILFFLCSIFL